MKKVSVFLVVCFLLAAIGVNTASAQSDQIGYIPLLSEGYDTSVPRELLSFDNFKAILPQLEDAKQKGDISGFEPDFYGGFVKVTYGSEISIQSDLGLPVYSTLKEAVVPAPSNFNSTGVIDSVALPHANLSLYSSCYNIQNLSAGAKVKALLYISGNLNGMQVSNADSSGYLWDCFDGIYNQMIPGSQVKFAIYNSAGVYQKTIAQVLPKITFTSVDQTNAIVKGTAPAGKAFSAYWQQPNLDADNTYTYQSGNGTVSSAGSWSVDFGTQKMRGNAHIELDIPLNSYFTVNRYIYLPATTCYLKNNYCYYNGLPNKAITISITHAGIKYNYSGKTDSSGWFYARVTDTNGDPVFLSAGDTVSATGIAAYKLSSLTLAINSSADTITGTAPANSYFSVIFWDLITGAGYWKYTHSDSSGKYIANFSGLADIPNSDLRAEIDYINKTTGNETVFEVMK